MNLITIKELSELLHVKTSTLYSWVHNGAIPFHKLNGLVRFDLDEIDAWVKSSKFEKDSLETGPKKIVSQSIDKIVRRAIDDSKGKAYNSFNGKPGRHQGLRKEA